MGCEGRKYLGVSCYKSRCTVQRVQDIINQGTQRFRNSGGNAKATKMAAVPSLAGANDSRTIPRDTPSGGSKTSKSTDDNHDQLEMLKKSFYAVNSPRNMYSSPSRLVSI